MDRERVRDLLGHLTTSHGRLDELVARPRKDYLADFAAAGSARYFIIAAVESALGMCNHIVARHGIAPASYADCAVRWLTDVPSVDRGVNHANVGRLERPEIAGAVGLVQAWRLAWLTSRSASALGLGLRSR